MVKYKFENSIKDLPGIIPIFPLNNVLLLPRCKLPLNLFEDRYLHMFDHALSTQRIIGMIQPNEKDSVKNGPNLYEIGCAGKIVAFSQTNDNRYEIVLNWLCRFKVIKETNLLLGFRQAKVSWKFYKHDLDSHSNSNISKRSEFEDKLKHYLKKINIDADWQAIEASSDEDLVNSISMSCPFNKIEKQALLESISIQDRMNVLTSLLDMSINENKGHQSSLIS